MPTPDLELISEDDLIDELGRRCDAWIFARVRSEGSEGGMMRYRTGGSHAA